MSVAGPEGAEDRVVVSVDLEDMTPEQAFDHWTRPDLLVRWWPETAEIDPRPGGRYRLSWPRMQWHLRGAYTQFDHGRALGFTWQWDHEPARPMRHVAVDFEPLPDAGTRVTVTHGFYGSSPAEREEREGHRDGWRHFLARLAGLGPGN